MPLHETRTHLREMQQEHPGDAQYYRFAPAEWRFESQGAQGDFNRISANLRSALAEIGDDRERFRWFRATLFETCVQALKTLRHEQVFAKFEDASEFLLLFAVSDTAIPAEVEIEWVARLNDPKVVAEFSDWLSTGAG